MPCNLLKQKNCCSILFSILFLMGSPSKYPALMLEKSS